MQPYPYSQDLRSRIQDHLDGFAIRRADRADLRNAAVAIVVARDDRTDHASVLITLRAQKLNRHGGQYALPGGRLDDGESDAQAALRELHEELGLDLQPADILGRLDDFPTRSGFRISPIVMWAPEGLEFRPDPSEVAEVFHIPLSELDNPDIPRLQPNANGDHPVLPTSTVQRQF